MRKHFNYAAVRLCLLAVILFITSAVYSQGFSPQTKARLQQILDSFQNNPANPYVGGLSVAIRVEGLAQWQGASGYASRNIDVSNNLLPGGTAFEVNTVSRAYSVTKTFTAALVLELAQEGVFSLDDPVGNYLPMGMINPLLNNTVTIRQLVSHESGYSDFLESINLQIAIAFQPTRTWNAFEAISFAHQENPPGLPRRYSSTNYLVLGALVEAVTGIPVEQHFRQRFFTPLQLNSMYLAGREAMSIPGTLADGHDNLSALNPIFQLTGQPVFPNTITNIRVFPFTAIETIAFTSGGIVSNAADLAKWGEALFTGQATSSFTRDLMVQSISPVPDADGDYLGYGIWRSTKIHPTDVFLGHDGNATGYRSVMFYQPQKKITLAILTNYHGAALYEVAKVLYAALPEFGCGNNGNDNKILVCFKGDTKCVARPAAVNMLRHGAYLGGCNEAARGSGNSPVLSGVTDESALKMSMKLYPNPTSGMVTITFRSGTAGKVSVSVYNSSGQLISTPFSGITGMGEERQLRISSGDLPAGIYIVKLQSDKGMYQQKLIVGR